VGAFVLVTDKATPDFETLATGAHRSLLRQGFSEPSIVRFSGGTLYVYPKQVAPIVNLLTLENGDFCAATGTFVYKGETGRKGLEAIYANFDIRAATGSHGMDVDRLHGAFCIVLQKDGRTFLFTDRVGVYKVYVDSSATVFSSSFLAVLETASSRRVDVQAVYEYVFQGATYGGDTLADDIKLVDPDFVCEPGVDLRAATRRSFGTPEIVRNDLDWHVERLLQTLKRTFAGIANAFGGHIDTALSGGYDSRLMLALLLSQNIRPDVHVYGADADRDVQVAKAIASGEGFPIAHTKKSSREVCPDQVEETILRTFYAFDGAPNDGVFDDGSDLATRRERCQIGALMLNGGGGEVLRNFFYLPARTFSVKQLLWSFYTQFDPATATDRFDESAFHHCLGEKLKTAIGGAEGDRLERTQIELAYPLFRCRFWMGRNNSVNSRFGSALTPFIDEPIVRQAVEVPLAYKNFGILEARLIAQASPALAAYTSEYGFPFDRLPPLSARIKAAITYSRPPFLRRYVFRVRNRRRILAPPPLLSAAVRDAVMKPGFPRTAPLFNAARLTDAAQFNRLCTLEYLFQRTDMAVFSRVGNRHPVRPGKKNVPAGT
jgi:hypothetical protein